MYFDHGKSNLEISFTIFLYKYTLYTYTYRVFLLELITAETLRVFVFSSPKEYQILELFTDHVAVAAVYTYYYYIVIRYSCEMIFFPQTLHRHEHV